MEPRVVTMHETNARDVFDTVETDGRLPLVLSQIHTARVSKRAFVLRINTGLLAMKARWLSATQSKQGRSEIRFPDLTHWPVNCCGSQWYSKLDPWHTFKRSFFFKEFLFSQKWHGTSSQSLPQLVYLNYTCHSPLASPHAFKFFT